jgi:hypothetical protein
MSAAANSTAPDVDVDTLMKMSLFEIMQKGIDPCNPKVKDLVDEYYKAHFGKEDDNEDDDENHEPDENDEAGLMDYRQDEISAIEKDRLITVILEFTVNMDNDCILPVPDDFEQKRCAKFNPKEIAVDALGEDYPILDAFWSGNKLNIIIDNMEEYYNPDEIIEILQDNSLEDGPYEAAPGESFWVVSYGELQSAISDE